MSLMADTEDSEDEKRKSGRLNQSYPEERLDGEITEIVDKGTV